MIEETRKYELVEAAHETIEFIKSKTKTQEEAFWVLDILIRSLALAASLTDEEFEELYKKVRAKQD
jgi:hypothetical protein